MSNNKTSVELLNISKYYKSKTILENISLKFYYGEIFGLLGPNGVGKTTLLKIITGLSYPSGGDVLINEKKLSSYHNISLSSMGAIIESPGLYFHLKGIDNLEIHRRMFNPNVSSYRVKELVYMLKLNNYINDKVRTYSLGMQQRLGIAIALLNNPKILILDEPTNGLDPEGINEFKNLLIDLVSMGTSIIISSHLLNDIEEICDRFAIIEQHKIIDIFLKSDLSDMKLNTRYLQAIQNIKEPLKNNFTL